MAWLRARLDRRRRRRDNWKEFEAVGVDQLRRRVENSIYTDEEKLTDARDWLHRRETRYQRFAVCISAASVLTAITALWVSYNSARNAVRADRAWVGPVSMRLSEKPAVGKPLQFFLEYQNTGRQPAQDVFYDPDSYSFNRDLAADRAERAKRHVEDCKQRQPNGSQLTIFPGRQTFTPYQIKKSSTLITKSVTNGTDLILIAGCFVYRTLDEVHRTAFCFEYDATNPQVDDDGRPIMDFCLNGNYAD
ncbi:hypothetical protein [Bradyrhizobium sp. UFLA05-112]